MKKRFFGPRIIENVEKLLVFVHLLYGGTAPAPHPHRTRTSGCTAPGPTTRPQRKTYTTRTLRSRSREKTSLKSRVWKHDSGKLIWETTILDKSDLRKNRQSKPQRSYFKNNFCSTICGPPLYGLPYMANCSMINQSMLSR